MNPLALAAVVVTWAGSVVAAGLWAYGAGQDHEIAAQSREDAAGRRAAEIAADVSAKAIGKLEIKHVTIRQDLEREVQTREIYRDCRSGPDAVNLLNQTIGVQHAESPDPTGRTYMHPSQRMLNATVGAAGAPDTAAARELLASGAAP